MLDDFYECDQNLRSLCKHMAVRFVLNPLKVKSESEVAQSCPTLCDPVDCSLSGSSVHGIFQARVLEWIAISFSWGSSRPRNRTQVSCIAGREAHLRIFPLKYDSHQPPTRELYFPSFYWRRLCGSASSLDLHKVSSSSVAELHAKPHLRVKSKVSPSFSWPWSN